MKKCEGGKKRKFKKRDARGSQCDKYKKPKRSHSTKVQQRLNTLLKHMYNMYQGNGLGISVLSEYLLLPKKRVSVGRTYISMRPTTTSLCQPSIACLSKVDVGTS